VQALNADPSEFERFLVLANAMPDLKFRYHGHVGPVDDHWGGNVVTTSEVAEQMRSARVGIHFKRWSDGYGHVLHNLFAVGKPVVATASYYEDKLGGPLFVEGVTSFDVQRHTFEETRDFIRRLIDDDELHERMSRASAARFREVVDFDAEAEQIRAMLDGVLSDRRVAA
jgi:glycosyltransferase involved in cell wall biosynthesis